MVNFQNWIRFPNLALIRIKAHFPRSQSSIQSPNRPNRPTDQMIKPKIFTIEFALIRNRDYVSLVLVIGQIPCCLTSCKLVESISFELIKPINNVASGREIQGEGQRGEAGVVKDNWETSNTARSCYEQERNVYSLIKSKISAENSIAICNFENKFCSYSIDMWQANYVEIFCPICIHIWLSAKKSLTSCIQIENKHC